MKHLRCQARNIAREARGILGPRPISRVIRDHAAFFRHLRKMGATWNQIAALMESEGLRSRQGKVVGPALFRALFARAPREKGTVGRKPNDQAGQHNIGKQPTKVSFAASIPAASVEVESLINIIERAAKLRGVKGSEDRS